MPINIINNNTTTTLPLSLLTTLTPPLHLFLYSTLLGTTLFQTFINTKIAFRALPRSAFTTLQKRIFPVYFRTQTLLLILSAVTFPPHGPVSLIRHKADWIPFAVATAAAGLNMVVFGPRTQKGMVGVVHQETRDKAQGQAGDEPSQDMKRLRRVFARDHAMAIHLNLVAIGAMVVYGWRLAGRLVVDVE